MKQRLIFFYILFINFTAIEGQTPFTTNTATDSLETDTSSVFIQADITQFFLNDEYFNPIVEGYTLFGTNLKSGLRYSPTSRSVIYAGLNGIKYFGEESLETIKPEIYISIEPNKKNTFCFGSMSNSPDKAFLPQLWNHEQAFTKTSPEGISYLFKNKRIESSTWVYWLDFLHPNEHSQEKILVGNITEYNVINKPGFQISLPVQLTVYHIGGQINDSWMPMYVILNNAAGIRIKVGTKGKTSFGYHYLGYKDASSTALYNFKNGDGHLFQVQHNNSNISASVSYWSGNRFIAPFGEAIYSSQSQRIPLDSPATHQNERRLIHCRFFYKHSFARSLTLLCGIQLYTDIKNNITDYSYNFILRYNDLFRLARIRKD